MILMTFQAKMLHYDFGHAFGLAMLCFAMLLLTQFAPKTRILSSTTHSPRFGAKSEIYYSLRIFAYLRGGCPLYLKQVLSVLSSGLLS